MSQAQKEFRQLYPRPGWVEHDPDEIWASQLSVARSATSKAGINPSDIAAIGITNQRETTVVWDRSTGRPLHNAIVWQCRRTAPLCDRLRANGLSETIREKTGLVIDPYFSGTKMNWLLNSVPGLAAEASAGRAALGTVDSWLIWNLTRGRVHATDFSNASRTMLLNLKTLRWDEELLSVMEVPARALPKVLPSSGFFGDAHPDWLGASIPIMGDAGDQQAALFGQGCFDAGLAKNTYGTGCFLLMNTGAQPIPSRHGLLSTVAWGLEGRVTYALEGSVFVTGAAVQWLRDGIGLVATAAETEDLAASVPDTGGVYLVPAFVGLGAPYWDPYARGLVIGVTRGTGRAHLVRATLEAIAYQTRDVIEAMTADSGVTLKALRVDGGAVVNNFLMQFQADILGVPVERPVVNETTALGAAYLAGLASGFWRDLGQLSALGARERVFPPGMGEEKRAGLYRGWSRAVERALRWVETDDTAGPEGSSRQP